jgi:hypothetical protein
MSTFWAGSRHSHGHWAKNFRTSTQVQYPLRRLKWSFLAAAAALALMCQLRASEGAARCHSRDETLGSPRDRQPKNRQTISIHYSGEKSQRLEIVSKVLSGDQPLVCVVLRIAGDHVANLGRAGLFVGHRYTDPSHVLAGLVGPQFCDLLATVLLKFHMFTVLNGSNYGVPRTPWHGRLCPTGCSRISASSYS